MFFKWVEAQPPTFRSVIPWTVLPGKLAFSRHFEIQSFKKKHPLRFKGCAGGGMAWQHLQSHIISHLRIDHWSCFYKSIGGGFDMFQHLWNNLGSRWVQCFFSEKLGWLDHENSCHLLSTLRITGPSHWGVWFGWMCIASGVWDFAHQQFWDSMIS